MKYELDQIVFYLKSNKLHSAKILGRKMVEMSKTGDRSTEDLPFHFYTENGNREREMMLYLTCHGEFVEKDLFASKEDLLNSL